MGKLALFQKLIVSKQSLLKCIFTTLIFQIIITTLVFNNVRTNPNRYNILFNKRNTIPILIALFVVDIILIITMTTLNINFYFKFLIFVLFSVIQGAILGVLLQYVDHTIINSALISTLAIFVVFLVFGLITVYFKLNLTWLGILLFICLIFIIVSRIVFIFISKNKSTNRYMSIASLILFSLYILYDTNNILLKYKNSGSDCINGALQYYLDIINIFTNSFSNDD